MKFATRMAVLFYVTLALFLSCAILMFAAQLVSPEYLTTFIHLSYTDPNLRLILAITGGVLLLMNFIFYNLFSVNLHREKIIAFDNPAGRVSVSLIALEDLLRRTVTRLAEVRESKITIAASKKGLRVTLRLSLCSEVSIPEITARVQELVREKIQTIVGIDEPVMVTIYVGKIFVPPTAKNDAVNAKGAGSDTHDSLNIPFQGYRA